MTFDGAVAAPAKSVFNWVTSGVSSLYRRSSGRAAEGRAEVQRGGRPQLCAEDCEGPGFELAKSASLRDKSVSAVELRALGVDFYTAFQSGTPYVDLGRFPADRPSEAAP